MNSKEIGEIGENMAAAYLAERGFEILERNYHYGHGDIDIVAREGACTVFIEVKMRTNTRFGPAIVAISPAKQAQVVRMARRYIWEHHYATIECRFDAVLIDMIDGEAVITHLRNAFQ